MTERALPSWWKQVRRCAAQIVPSIIIGLAILCSPTGVSWGQLVSLLSSAQMQAIEVIADYIVQDNTDALLREAGYISTVPEDIWRQFPSERKIETAFVSAERAKSGSGKAFLAKLAYILSDRYGAAAAETSLRIYLEAPRPAEAIIFAPPVGPPAAEIRDNIPEVIKMHIVAISDVASRGSLGGLSHVMVRRLGLSVLEAYEILRNADSGRAALVEAFRVLGNPPRNRVLAEMAQDVQSRFEGARKELSLNDVISRYRFVEGGEPTSEWFDIRDRMEQLIETGQINATPEKMSEMRKTMQAWKQERIKIAALWAEQGVTASPAAWERAFYEYTQREPRMAALWGFAVIGMYKDQPAFDRYLDGSVKSFLADSRKEFVRDLVKSVEESSGYKLADLPLRERRELAGVIDGHWKEREAQIRPMVEAAVKEAGPKPYMGYQLYVLVNGFASREEVEAYVERRSFNEAVDLVCPK